MNNAKMWLVVKPTVGVPLFLGAVALGSLTVHTAVLRNTTWLPAFLQGKAMATASVDTPADGKALVKWDGSSQEGIIVMPDGRTARVEFVTPDASTDATRVASTNGLVAN